MPDFLHYSFMVRALIAGVLVGLSLPLLGCFLVARRYSLIADSLAHVSLAGVAAGLLLGFSPVGVALPVTVVGALLIEYLRQSRQLSGEASLAIIMSGGLALAVVLANLAHGTRVDFSSYLFGSITTTQWGDIWLLMAAAVIIALVIWHSYRLLLFVAVDEDGARVTGLKVGAVNYLLAALTAALVVLSLRIIGGLLISALLVVPVMSAARFARSFATTMLWAVVFALVAVSLGLVASFYIGVAAGGAIVLTALLLFGISILLAG